MGEAPAGALAASITATPGLVTGAAYVTVPAGGAAPTMVATAPLGSFPRAGADYAVLSSGDADPADGLDGSSLGGGPVRGDTDFDVTILRVDLQVPAGAECLAFDFRYYSEEFPDFVGSG